MSDGKGGARGNNERDLHESEDLFALKRSGRDRTHGVFQQHPEIAEQLEYLALNVKPVKPRKGGRVPEVAPLRSIEDESTFVEHPPA